MDLRGLLDSWPVARQLRTGDRLGLGQAAQSPRSAAIEPRTRHADKVVALLQQRGWKVKRSSRTESRGTGEAASDESFCASE